MSSHVEVKRVTVPQLMALKGQHKIVGLTAHNFSTARIIDEYVDFVLIGDSTAMVAYGLPDTLSFTVEQIGQHTAAVVKATRHACVVADMPFGSYQESHAQAFRHAAYLLGQGASAVKLEGGAVMAETVHYLVTRGVPVMAHVGLMPQYVNTMGGYLAQGRSPEAAARILADAQALEQAGAFAVVLEGVAEPLGESMTAALAIPTIGIGASVKCDGQILVTEDMLGLSGERVPKFVKRYANLEEIMRTAVQRYADEVRESKFPELQHCFGVTRT